MTKYIYSLRDKQAIIKVVKAETLTDAMPLFEMGDFIVRAQFFGMAVLEQPLNSQDAIYYGVHWREE